MSSRPQRRSRRSHSVFVVLPDDVETLFGTTDALVHERTSDSSESLSESVGRSPARVVIDGTA